MIIITASSHFPFRHAKLCKCVSAGYWKQARFACFVLLSQKKEKRKKKQTKAKERERLLATKRSHFIGEMLFSNTNGSEHGWLLI